MRNERGEMDAESGEIVPLKSRMSSAARGELREEAKRNKILIWERDSRGATSSGASTACCSVGRVRRSRGRVDLLAACSCRVFETSR